jgi:hypothetical protein
LELLKVTRSLQLAVEPTRDVVDTGKIHWKIHTPTEGERKYRLLSFEAIHLKRAKRKRSKNMKKQEEIGKITEKLKLKE